jgi:citrate synthase
MSNKSIPTSKKYNAERKKTLIIDPSRGCGVQFTFKPSTLSKINPQAKKNEDKIFMRDLSLLSEFIDLNYENAIVYFLTYDKKYLKSDEPAKMFKRFRKTNSIANQILEIPQLEHRPGELLSILVHSLAYQPEVEQLSELEQNIQLISGSAIFACQIINKYFGRDQVEPDPELSHIENILYMVGKNHQDEQLVEYISKMMLAWTDLGLAPSAVPMRADAAVETDIYTALSGGIGNMTGKAHTSARIDVVNQFFEYIQFLKDNGVDFPLKKKERTEAKKLLLGLIQKKLSQGERIKGFGHWFFRGLDKKGFDPRIQLVVDAINEIYPDNDYLELVEILREIFAEGLLRKKDKIFQLPPNSDLYWAAFLMEFYLDYEQPEKIAKAAPTLNLLSRIPGLIAQYREQEGQSIRMRFWYNSSIV